MEVPGVSSGLSDAYIKPISFIPLHDVSSGLDDTHNKRA